MTRIVQPTPEAIAEATEILRGGGLVAFPTETVYGLGANALDTDAVAHIFAAKGRPSTNPIIVHVSSIEDARKLAEFSPKAEALAREYWPGPLTLVLPKLPVVPSIVTAGGPTVGIRVPRHPVALALLAACGLPLAAPSANRSEEISPTLAQHVADSLGSAVDMILDGGPCEVGIESTVIDVTGGDIRVLRAGTISDQEDSQSWGELPHWDASSDSPQRSPGSLPRHYAPRTPLVLAEWDVFWHAASETDYRIPLLGFSPPGTTDLTGRVYELMPSDPMLSARALYAALRRLDHAAQQNGAAYILAQAPPFGFGWGAIRDRLTRAST